MAIRKPVGFMADGIVHASVLLTVPVQGDDGGRSWRRSGGR